MLWTAAVQKAIKKSSLCFTALIRDLVYNQKKYPKTRNVAACTSPFKMTGGITVGCVPIGATLEAQIP